MGQRQKEWAVRARAELVEELGGACVRCGSKNNLELDHKYKRKWTVEKVGSDSRVSRLRREAKRGLIQVLCKSCNVKKGTPEHEEPLLKVEEKEMLDGGEEMKAKECSFCFDNANRRVHFFRWFPCPTCDHQHAVCKVCQPIVTRLEGGFERPQLKLRRCPGGPREGMRATETGPQETPETPPSSQAAHEGPRPS